MADDDAPEAPRAPKRARKRAGTTPKTETPKPETPKTGTPGPREPEPAAPESGAGEGVSPPEAGRAGTGDAATGAGADDPPGPVTASAGPGSPDPTITNARIRELIAELPPQARNRFTPGTLTVHYATRDVEFPVDGETGLRLIALLGGTDIDIDTVDVDSDAQQTWLMIDRTQVLGARWTPNDAAPPQYLVVDPPARPGAVA